MADQSSVDYGTAVDSDYTEHERTYRFFVRMVKTSVAVIAVILVALATFLT